MIKDVTNTSFYFQSSQRITEPSRSETGKNPERLQQKTAEVYPEDSANVKDVLEKVVNSLNDFMSPISTHLKFEFHEDLKEYYVTIVDIEKNEVIKEIPPKKMLDMYAAMAEYLGLLVDRKI